MQLTRSARLVFPIALFTLIAAALYNVIAGMVGGIEIETQ